MSEPDSARCVYDGRQFDVALERWGEREREIVEHPGSAAIVAIGLARLLQPLFPVPLSVPASATMLLPVIALVVGLLASVSAVRRAVSIDPALAFGGP